MRYEININLELIGTNGIATVDHERSCVITTSKNNHGIDMKAVDHLGYIAQLLSTWDPHNPIGIGERRTYEVRASFEFKE